MKAPAFYTGHQLRPDGTGFDLYTLTEPIGDMPAGSTLAGPTLQKMGFELPPREEAPCLECEGTLGRHQRGCLFVE